MDAVSGPRHALCRTDRDDRLEGGAERLRERLQARDDNVLEIVRKGEELTLKGWADLFLENYSRPPLRMPKTHEANTRAVMHLNKVFGDNKLAALSSDGIEGYLRHRLRQRVKRKTKAGIVERGVLNRPQLTGNCACFGAC